MSKIGNTDCWVFNIISDICVFASTGGEIVIDSAPDTPGKVVPIKIISDLGSNDVVEPIVKKALMATASMASAIGRGQIVAVENAQEGGETKYTITIKERDLCPKEG